MSLKFGLGGLQDAQAWLEHPILSIRLLDCTQTILKHREKPIISIMEFPDDLKLHSSITLFHLADPSQHMFSEVLNVFYNGKLDLNTLDILKKNKSKSKSKAK